MTNNVQCWGCAETIKNKQDLCIWTSHEDFTDQRFTCRLCYESGDSGVCSGLVDSGMHCDADDEGQEPYEDDKGCECKMCLEFKYFEFDEYARVMRLYPVEEKAIVCLECLDDARKEGGWELEDDVMKF